MEQSIRHGCSSKWYTKEEKDVAKILMELQDSEPPPLLNWGRKRKRSAIQDSSPPLVFLQNLYRDTDTQTVVVVKKENASSPDTPLSFPHTQSDYEEKPKKPPLKKKKIKEEYCLGSIEDLTKQKASLDEELYNVKLFYAKAKAFNLKLIAKKQELINRQKSEYYKNPNLEFGGSMQSVHVNGSVNPLDSKAQNAKQRQPQMEMQIPMTMPIQNQFSGPSQILHNSERFVVSGHPTTSLQVPSSSSNGLGHVNANEAQLALPDLNISAEEFTQVNSSQPLDEATANRDLNRAIAAEARRKRITIFRLKNPVGPSKKPRYNYR